MKKSLIKSKLSPSYAALYDLSCRMSLETGLRRMLAERISSLRYELKRAPDDKLFQKMKNLGNDGQWGRDMSRKLARIIFEPKTPSTVDLGQWVSVEIECIFLSSNKENEFSRWVRKSGYSKHVTLKDDGSLRVSDDDGSGEYYDHICEVDADCDNTCNDSHRSSSYGKEVVVTFKRGETLMISEICRKLTSLGCYVNKSCGLHVHFDMRHVSSANVTTFAKRVARCVPALKLLLPKSRQNNQYCQNVINKHKSGSRYSFVNLHSYRKYQTLEIRGHSGTLDANKMIHWIDMISVIMSVRSTVEVNTIALLVESFRFKTETIKYILDRSAKFNDKTEMSDIDDVLEDNQAA